MDWLERVWGTVVAYKWSLLYIALVFIFCTIQYVVPVNDAVSIILEMAALLLLPAAILSARFIGRRIAAPVGAEAASSDSEAAKSVEIVIETVLALAVGFLLVNAKELATGMRKPFEDKVPEISLVFILVFAVHTVWKSSSMFDNFVERAKDEVLQEIQGQVRTLKEKVGEIGHRSSELEHLQGQFGSTAERMEKSAGQIEAARYAALAARVLGIKSADDFMIQGNWGRAPDPHLPGIAERALDALHAWVQTGFSIDKRGGGDEGRQTWWRLMETYHREEVFDITQLEVATNVRNFAMMLLLAIRNYLVGDERADKDKDTGKPTKRVILVNVSKFPPKDFYNFPDGAGKDRFYHEPEFFGTYRRALSVVTRHPGIKPVRIFLCAPEPEPEPAEAQKQESRIAELPKTDPSDARAKDRRASKTVGSDAPSKIAVDCANMDFLPVPLTFTEQYEALERFNADTAIPESLKYLYDKLRQVFRELPMGVKRALIEPHSQWPLPEDDVRPKMRTYRETALSKSERSAEKCREQSNEFRRDAPALLRRGLASHTPAADDANPASFRFQEEQAWRALVHRCLRYGTPGFSHDGDSRALYEAVRGTLQKMSPTLDAQWLAAAVRPYQDSYWRYLDAVQNAFNEFEQCQKIADKIVVTGKETTASRQSYTDDQRTIAKLVLSLLSRCQMIDSLDKYFEMITPSSVDDQTRSSTGIALGSGENWLHRALILLEAELICEDVERHGPIPLWKLFANDLCGITDPWAEPTEALKKFRRVLPNRIRMYNPKEHPDAEVLNEFLLIGIEKEAMSASNGDQAGHDAFRVDDVDWKALIGTYINEPFHTCRIKFDFVGKAFEPKQGAALKMHVKWVKEAWEKGQRTTDDFQRELGEAWDRRLKDEALAEHPVSRPNLR